jgi:transcriptional regulator
VLDRTTSGNVHQRHDLARRADDLPFGGVGASGMGAVDFSIGSSRTSDPRNTRSRPRRRQGQCANGLFDMQNGCGTIPKSFMGAQETRELLPGTLDMLILKVLSRGEMHGYGIVSAIQRASDDVLGVVEGALYPALHRLEVRGWVRSKWGVSDNNRRAKFYRLSALGRRALEEEAAYWNRVASAVTRVMQSA